MDREAGFTLIELIIVIAIIGVLLTITGFVSNGALVSSRDSERADDTASIARLLEVDYNNQIVGSPSYPSTQTFINDIASGSGTAAGTDPSIFEAPSATSSSVVAATSITTVNPAGANTPLLNYYYYQPITAANTLCQTSSQTCVLFRLIYQPEAGGSPIIINSAHQQ